MQPPQLSVRGQRTFFRFEPLRPPNRGGPLLLRAASPEVRPPRCVPQGARHVPVSAWHCTARAVHRSDRSGRCSTRSSRSVSGLFSCRRLAEDASGGSRFPWGSTSSLGWCTARLRLGEPFADRESHQVRAGGDAQLPHHAVLVPVDRLGTSAQLGGNLHTGESLADQPKDLRLAYRQ